ncbi:unnamed protein product [Symbiodinium natans]|uniref:Uncharacterized protein n=1 Tax=Symbiodinium natans TaxID=878477 RepID=A0A812SW62_9DINO|nr:unnamed protein product [Symbiodinium natans]
MKPLEAAHGGAQAPSAGRRYIGCEEHMQDAGTSVPFAGRHGCGRRHLPAHQDNLNHLNLFKEQKEQSPPDERLWSRNGPLPHQSPPRQPSPTSWEGYACAESAEVRIPSPSEMKDSLKEWLRESHNLEVGDVAKWNEVAVEKNGMFWIAFALNSKGISLSREGPSARALAQKLSTLPATELRHFGLRFQAPQSQEIRSANMSLQSSGVHESLGSRAGPADGISYTLQDAETSNAAGSRRTRSPEDVRKRYIASGKDNFSGLGQAQVEAPQGGRRFIEIRDNLTSGATLKENGEDSRAFLPRRAGHALNQGSPLW